MRLLFPLARTAALSTTLLTISSLAYSQNAAGPDDALTWKGITLYGTVDVGLQYNTHSAPGNDYLTFTTDPVVQRYSNKSTFGVVSNPLSASRIGLSGIAPITSDWSGVFKLETYFNPTSGDLIDSLHSITQNNGVPLNQVSSYADSSNDGQPFEVAIVGISSKIYGTFTFGRQTTPLADGVVKYDIMEDGVDAANSFSLIGNSRAGGGGGDTQNARLDHSIRYAGRFDRVHVGLLYQPGDDNGGNANTAMQAQIGYDYEGISVDAFASKKYDGIAASPLTAAQVAALPPGASLDNSLAGTVSDNTAFAVMLSYTLGPLKLSGGYNHLRYANPKHPLAVGANDINGYVLQAVTNNAYNTNKLLDIFWFGGKYYLSPKLYVAASYYGYRQNSYATGANAGCSGTTVGSCSGGEDAVGVLIDYRFNRHFDTYAGGLYTSVNGGLDSGFLSSNDLALTTGLRFTF